MKTHRSPLRRWLTGTALLLSSLSASAHIGYSGRDFGTVVPNTPPVTLTNQSVTSNFGWADGTDADFGDSHKVRAYRFKLNTAAYVTLTFSGSTNGGTKDGSIKPGFSIYQGLAHLAPITDPPGSADHDGSAISLAYLASLGGVAKEGVFRSLNDWRVGGDNQTGPVFDFEAADGLSTFVYKGHAVDGDATLFGSAPGIVGDGNADGTVTKSMFLPAGDYSIFVGGANYAGQAPTADATSYGLTGTISASAFTYVAGDPSPDGLGYQHQVTLDSQSSGSFSSHVGAWSWEDNSLFGGPTQGSEPVGWVHTSNWAAIRVETNTLVTITMSRDAGVPWPSPENPDRKADTSSMFPSMTLFRGWQNTGDLSDNHTYNNRGNISWAPELQYMDHVDNSTESSITRTYYLPAGDYTLALGSNAPATNTNRQGFNLAFSTQSYGEADPVPNTYLPPEYIGTGGIGYAQTVVAKAGETGSFSNHVGAWSWEDNALFSPGQPPVGWTHTSNWVALKVEQDLFFSLTVERDATVPWPSTEEPNRLADTSSMFPSLTLYRGWDNDGSDHHTFNNRGNVLWAEDIRYMEHLDNSTETKITRTWRLPAGTYTLNIGSNAPATNPNRQGFKATFRTHQAAGLVSVDPVADEGIPYAHVISVGRGDTGTLSNHVGAWSWEDNALFSPGQPPVGWTHTSRWVAVHVKDHLRLNITMARDANVPWPSTELPDRKASTESMFPSFTLWRGWDNDGDDSHTYNNRGNVSWAEDLSYVDHCDNSSATTITRSYTLAPGYYTLALGSNAPATDTNRQGFSFSWNTGTPVLLAPVITQQPRGAEILATRSHLFTVRATGPELSYQWFHQGKPLAGPTALTNTLTVSNADLDDAGSYTCIVRNAAGWVTTTPALLTVIARPVVNAFDIPNLVIGQPFETFVTASNGPTNFAIRGLPRGLALDVRTGRISGRPIEARACSVEVTASNKAGLSVNKETDTFTVVALTTGTSGSFVGPVGRSASINALLGGIMRLQVSSLGALTGTLTLGNSAPLRIAAALDTSLAQPAVSFSLARSGQPTLNVSVVVDAAAKAIFGEIHDGSNVLPYVARQPLTAAGSYLGDYTLAMSLNELDVGDVTVPQGHSIGAFKVATNATTAGILTLADNTKITFSSAIESNGHLSIFSVLYRGVGSLLGQFSLEAGTGNLAASDISWYRGPVARDLVYADGFGPLTLDVIGRKYIAPAATVLPMGALAGPGNAAISFAEGGVADIGTRLDTDKLQIELTKVTVAPPALGTPVKGNLKVSITAGLPGRFVAGTSGTFKGSFELTDTDTSVTPNRSLIRKVDFQGMIVNDGTKLNGYGFFLLPQMPTASPRTTLTTSPRLSGRVMLIAD